MDEKVVKIEKYVIILKFEREECLMRVNLRIF